LALLRGTAQLRISVIIPACNEQPYLQRTFEQFQATLPPRSEIIVVDNGSSDGCADFLADPDLVPPSAAPRPIDFGDGEAGVAVRLLRYDTPLGVARARNRGLDHARGEVLVFVDANVDVPPGWWPPLVEVLNRPGVGMVAPAIGGLGDRAATRGCGMHYYDAFLSTAWTALTDKAPHPVPVVGGTMMVTRREVLDHVGGYDDGMRQRASEDMELSLRLWLFGYELWVVPEVDVPHLFRAASPYPVDGVSILYNQLRAGFLHLSDERLARFLE
jgi:glycosyltransferase involved in cell wall biosynthesis